MKRWVLTGLMVCIGFAACGELSKRELKRLEDLEIAGIRESSRKNDDRTQDEILEINTFQSEDDPGEGFRIHIAVELLDKNKKTYLVEYKGNRPGGVNSEYTGEDYWLFYMPHGELERLKISAYAIRYGFMDGEEFLVFAEKFDDVKTMEELLERTSTPYSGKARLKHYYMYDDSSQGETESISQNVRSIK